MLKVHDVKTYELDKVNDGDVFVSYTGELIVMPLIDFNSIKDSYVQLEKMKTDADNNIKKAQEHNKKVMEVFKKKDEALRKLTYDNEKIEEDAERHVKEKYLSAHHASDIKVGCGRRADAEIIVKAVLGASISELQKTRFTYDRLGHKKIYSRGKIFEALSVKKVEDYQRISNLLIDFPDVFCEVTNEQVFTWFEKRLKKGGKNK